MNNKGLLNRNNDEGLLQRADKEKLREIFLEYATIEKNGEKYITNDDFVRKFLGLFEDGKTNQESVDFIASIVDANKDGVISFAEFEAFEGLLCVPDPLYRTAFLLFDVNADGLLTLDEFESVMKNTALYEKFPFNMDSAFIRLYFSHDKKRPLTYQEFTQFLHDFHDAYWLEAFKKCDKNETGYISIEDFRLITLTIKKHLLTKDLEKIVITSHLFPGTNKISFPYYMAFSSVLNNMELIKRVYYNATNGSRTRGVTKERLLHYGQMKSQLTPLEIDILFDMCAATRNTYGEIVFKDLEAITPEQYFKHIKRYLARIQAAASPEERSVLIQIAENLYRFVIGGLAGATGSAMVYPVDLVKTRVQNQRKTVKPGEIMYKNLWDCFKKVLEKESVFGLYKGLLVQLMGVMPEKAVKLTVNDFVRDKFIDKQGKISVYAETFAGCCAGVSQVIITNPLEIVKIRLQVAGGIAGGNKISAWCVIKDLGLKGLYKGARSCMLRDFTFNGIYFPVYHLTKRALTNEHGYNHPITLLAAGAFAGIPAAFLATPADVIKTRLQVIARSGQTAYNGILDAFSKILIEEGPTAFFKGGLARVLRSSPQFGVTLATYELLQRLFVIDFAGTRPGGARQEVVAPAQFSMKPHHIGGYRIALPVFTSLETRFGISLPRGTVNKPDNPS